MLETPHVMVAAAIATKIGNPLLAIPLALGSHFLLERIPHWNPHLKTETDKYGKPTTKTMIITTADAVTALFSGSLIAARALPDTGHALTILLACFFSVIPDLLESPYFFMGARNKLLIKYILWQKSIQEDAKLIPGILTQLVIIGASLWWILK
jgi:hypothetical protein